MDPAERLLTKWRINEFYHFTDTRNLPSIRRHGLLSWAKLSRHGIKVAAPGGNDWSHSADADSGMDGYVHLCLVAKHPMEHNAKKDGRIEDSQFLEINSDIIHVDGATFTNGVSNKTGVSLVGIADADEELDLGVLFDRPPGWWQDQEFVKRLCACEKYELLIPRAVPVDYILNL